MVADRRINRLAEKKCQWSKMSARDQSPGERRRAAEELRMPGLSLAWRIVLAHYLPGILATPVLWIAYMLLTNVPAQDVGLSIRGFGASGSPLALAAIVVIPLILGLFLDDIRHAVEVRHPNVQLAQPFRHVYDEYYYYVEFDGNSALGIAVSTVAIVIWFVRWAQFAVAAVLLLLGAGIALLLWANWSKTRSYFEFDVRELATGKAIPDKPAPFLWRWRRPEE